MKIPTISVIIATFNSERTIEECLESFKNQEYPKNNLEIIIADGGSTDKTVTIARSFHCYVIEIDTKKQNAEYNKGIGLTHAKKELVLFIDHDNVLPHKYWLINMVEPLIKHKDLVAVEPLRYHYNKKLNLLDRYFALFGVNDPVPYYLGKADRMDYIHEKYNLLGEVIEESDSRNLGRLIPGIRFCKYYIVEFDKHHPHQIPTLGANGFLIRRTILKKAKSDPDHFFHIDVNVDLVKSGYTKYAFIRDSVIHKTNNRLIPFLSRRLQFIDEYYWKRLKNRRYSVYMIQDNFKLILFIFYSLTFVKPFVDSVRGYMKIKDAAWFLHPVMCFVFACIYGHGFVRGSFRKIQVYFLSFRPKPV